MPRVAATKKPATKKPAATTAGKPKAKKPATVKPAPKKPAAKPKVAPKKPAVNKTKSAAAKPKPRAKPVTKGVPKRGASKLNSIPLSPINHIIKEVGKDASSRVSKDAAEMIRDHAVKFLQQVIQKSIVVTKSSTPARTRITKEDVASVVSHDCRYKKTLRSIKNIEEHKIRIGTVKRLVNEKGLAIAKEALELLVKLIETHIVLVAKAAWPHAGKRLTLKTIDVQEGLRTFTSCF